MATQANGTVYDVVGPTAAPAVVLVHGLGLHRRLWAPYVDALSTDYRVLTYDLYGHGESAVPPRTPDLTLFAEQIIDLMDEIGVDRACIVGFSLGGMINRRLAIDAPDRVASLAILNSPHDRGPEQQALVEQRAVDTASGGPGATLDATIQRWFTPDFIADRPEVIADIRAAVLANDHDIYAACRFVLANGVVELIRPDPPITHPTLVVTCEHDSGSTPAMSHAIGDEIDGSQVVIVPDLQHMGLVEQPRTFLDILRPFLATTTQNGTNR